MAASAANGFAKSDKRPGRLIAGEPSSQPSSTIERLILSGWISRLTFVVLTPFLLYYVVCLVSAALFRMTL